jgi:hypothetical protein
MDGKDGLIFWVRTQIEYSMKNHDNVRTIVYKSFDTHGIRVKQMAKVNLSLNLDDSKSLKTSQEFIFIPFINEITISEIELENYIYEYIYDTTGFQINSIHELNSYPNIKGLPFILKLNEWSQDNMAFYLAFGKIPGSVTFRAEHKIISLGNIEQIDGELVLSETEINDLGKLNRVGGSFWIAQTNRPFTKLENLGDLRFVGGDLNIKSSPIKSLSNLINVGGTLNLRKTSIESLGELMHVGGHLYLPKHLKGYFDLSKIQIDGKVKYFSE